MTNWPITETYHNALGEFVGYDTTVSGTNTILQNQQHIDIRGFVPSGIVTLPYYSMLQLDTEVMSYLDEYTMGQLEINSPFGDQWSSGTVGPISALNNTIGLTWTLVSGMNSTVSTLPAVSLAGFQPTDYVCLSLPNFPNASINLAGSYVSLYDGANTTNLYLNNVFNNIEASNFTCAAWYNSELGAVQNPITVGLHFDASAPCTVEVTGLRLISQEWTPMTLDVNTQGHFLRRITTQSGTTPTTAYPMAWRCAVPQGINDPRPINSNFGALFYTGSLTQNATIDLYFRGRNETVTTQQTLDYVPATGSGYLQENLDALGVQPDYNESIFPPASGAGSSYYIQAILTYGSSTNWTITLNNLTAVVEDTYTFTGTGIEPNSYYLFNVNISDNTVVITISPASSYGTIESPALYTSPNIINTHFRRTAGRIGWNVQFLDGDAFIKTFVGQSLMFAEYRSKVFQSRTPVRGASLTVSATPPESLLIGTEPSGQTLPYNGGIVTANLAISASADGSTQIYGASGQGMQTQIFVITNLSNFEIQFSLYVPAATLNLATPTFALMSSAGYIFPFQIGEVLPNTWQNYVVQSTSFGGLLPGCYSFLTLSVCSTPTVWYIDNLSITQASIIWSARSAYQDPWNADPIPWVSFGNLLNDLSDGVTFSPAGNALQVRAQSFSQGSVIDKFLITPQYSQLGNLIF